MALSDETVDPIKRWAVPSICVAGTIAYLAVPSFQFVHDDRIQILENSTLLHMSSISQYFLHHVWSYIPDMPASYYRPLFSAWLNLNYALFGRHAAGWHIAVLCLHLLASVLTYRLIWTVFRSQATGLLAALVFAVHPVHVESVAWISGSTDPLAAIFVISAFLTYRKTRYARGRMRVLTIFASLACFACALLIKEAALLFPILLILDSLLLSQNERPPRTVVASVLPYFLLAAAYCLIRVKVIGSFSPAHIPLPAATLFYTLPSVLFFYLGLLLFPMGLSLFYDTPYVTSPDFLHFWIPCLVLLGAGVITYACIRQLAVNRARGEDYRKQCVFFLLWAALFLIPALDLKVLDPGEIAHDRYLYIPSIGFFAVAAFLVQQLATKMTLPRRMQAVLWAAIIAVLAFATAMQSFYWTSDFVLYRRGVSVAPANLSARNNLANIYLESGDFERGIALHREILQKDPSHAESYYNIGMVYYNQGNFAVAESYFKKALSLRTRSDWYFRLGIAQFKNGEFAAAEGSLTQALHSAPQQPEFHIALGAVYEAEGKLPLALQEFEAAQRLDPANQPVRNEIVKIKQKL
jgi:tetratricopeptide (TPR) repeat protein